MFTPRRPIFHHPYKPSAHRKSPAGVRIVDYITPKPCFNLVQGPDFLNTCSPGPSPLNSPVRDPRQPDDNAPPTFRLADLFGDNGLESPFRPSAPRPEVQLKAFTELKETRGPSQFSPPNPSPNPQPNPPRRKNKYGPKHLSFNSGAIRPDILPHHHRAKQTKEKRDTARKRILDCHERRIVRAREGFCRLRREVKTLMRPHHMGAEDKIFIEQLANLGLNQELNHDLEQCRQRMARAAADANPRRREQGKRDQDAGKLWGERRDVEALEEQKRRVTEFVRADEEQREACLRRKEEAAMRVDEERQRAHEAQERRVREEQERHFRQEMERKVKEEEEHRRRKEEERRLQEERERRLREERERHLREEMEQKLREERERRLREAMERKKREEEARKLEERMRWNKEYHEQFMREERGRRTREERRAREERERQARILAEETRRAAQQQAEERTIHQHFAVYEGKWNELRTSDCLPPIDVQEVPWPVFGVISSADRITMQDVRTFLFHPQRPGVEGKTARDKVKSEVLRFHPDKFNARILPKIHPAQQAVALAIAGVVARILTEIMTEEAA